MAAKQAAKTAKSEKKTENKTAEIPKGVTKPSKNESAQEKPVAAKEEPKPEAPKAWRGWRLGKKKPENK